MTTWRAGSLRTPVIAVPTITLEGDANGAPHLDAGVYAKKFKGRYKHRVIGGRRRAPPAAGSAASVCGRDHRSRQSLIRRRVQMSTQTGHSHAARRHGAPA